MPPVDGDEEGKGGDEKDGGDSKDADGDEEMEGGGDENNKKKDGGDESSKKRACVMKLPARAAGSIGYRGRKYEDASQLFGSR